MSKDLVKNFRRAVVQFSKVSKLSRTEVVNMILPTVLEQVERELRQSVIPVSRDYAGNYSR